MKSAADRKSTRILTKRIYMVCLAMGVLFAASNIHLLVAAGKFVDAHQNDTERHLVEGEIEQLKLLTARDQAQISRWDQAVEAVYHGGDVEAFARREFAGWFWNDFGITLSAIVDGDGTVDVAVREGRIVDPAEATAAVMANADLLRRAEARYDLMKVRFESGYTVRSDPLDRNDPIYVAELRRYEGQPAVVVAQAIIPDGTALVPFGPPSILLTVKFVTPGTVEQSRRFLGLNSFTIGGSIEVGAREQLHTLWLNERAGERPIRVTWTSEPDSQAMWDGVLPVLGAIFVIMISCLVFVARGQGRAARVLAEREAENRFLAFHDPLTGLANRLKFDSTAEELLEDHAEESWAIACIDLDEFKAVNDTYGHHAGDAVLCKAADVVRSMAGENGLAARIGGDEFMVLFTGETGQQQLRCLCETMISRLSQDMYFEGGKARISASIGVAWYRRDGFTVKEVIRAADAALYRAKQAGRGATHFAGEQDGASTAPLRRSEGRAA
jgi:diguanylate cyclase (GGDEF)-like protein